MKMGNGIGHFQSYMHTHSPPNGLEGKKERHWSLQVIQAHVNITHPLKLTMDWKEEERDIGH